MAQRPSGTVTFLFTDVEGSTRLWEQHEAGMAVALELHDEIVRSTIDELGMTEGFDIGMEMSGSGQAFREMLEVMNNGGRIGLLGIPPTEVAIDWNLVIFKGLFLKGIYGREMFETWYKMATMLMSGLDVEPVLTHRFPIEDFDEGFQVMMGGRCGKIVLDWT